MRKASGVFWGLWGVLHVLGGAGGVAAFLTKPATELLRGYGPVLLPAPAPGPAVDMAAHLSLDFALLLVGYGALGIVTGIKTWRGRWDGFWLAVALIGLADGAFIVALVLPGYAGASGWIGPVLYLIASGLGVVAKRREPSPTRAAA